jgi:guanylate kinase
MSNNILVVLSGPSGAGKSTLVRMVLDDYEDFIYSVSATTRAPRPGEVEGKDYFFVDEERFREMIENNELIEWAKVFGTNYYGTPKTFIEETLMRKNIIIDVDIQGGLQVMETFPDAVFIFVKVDSMKTLENRIRGRGDVSEEDLRSRLETSRNEMEYSDRYNYIITNTDLDQAYSELKRIINQKKAS